MACNDCGNTKVDCGCTTEALSISQVCNPVVCAVEECSETFSSGCVLYSGDNILCGDVIVVTKGDTIAQAITNITAFFCATEGLVDAISCGADTVVPASTSFGAALPLIVAYFCDKVTAIETDITALQTYTTFLAGLITQSDTAVPAVATGTNGNTIGAIVWTRASAGSYTGTLVGAFTGVVVCSLVQGSFATPLPGFMQISRWSDDTIEIRTYSNAAGVLADDLLSNANIRIEVYAV